MPRLAETLDGPRRADQPEPLICEMDAWRATTYLTAWATAKTERVRNIQGDRKKLVVKQQHPGGPIPPTSLPSRMIRDRECVSPSAMVSNCHANLFTRYGYTLPSPPANRPNLPPTTTSGRDRRRASDHDQVGIVRGRSRSHFSRPARVCQGRCFPDRKSV